MSRREAFVVMSECTLVKTRLDLIGKFHPGGVVASLPKAKIAKYIQWLLLRPLLVKPSSKDIPRNHFSTRKSESKDTCCCPAACLTTFTMWSKSSSGRFPYVRDIIIVWRGQPVWTGGLGWDGGTTHQTRAELETAKLLSEIVLCSNAACVRSGTAVPQDTFRLPLYRSRTAAGPRRDMLCMDVSIQYTVSKCLGC